MNEEKLFVVCNIPKLLEKQLSDVRNQCIDGMSKENMEGYDYAVETVLSLIRQTIYAAEMDNETLVHSDRISEEHKLEEFDLHGLLELLSCRAVAQFSGREEEE